MRNSHWSLPAAWVRTCCISLLAFMCHTHFAYCTSHSLAIATGLMDADWGLLGSERLEIFIVLFLYLEATNKIYENLYHSKISGYMVCIQPHTIVMETKINSNLETSEEQGRNSDCIGGIVGYLKSEESCKATVLAWKRKGARTEFTHGSIHQWLQRRELMMVRCQEALSEGVSLETGSNRNETNENYLGWAWVSPTQIIQRCFAVHMCMAGSVSLP